MNALWPLGEATVRDIRAQLAESRPRAYTTVMTIMDRLARKGMVTRRRAGRAWVYRPGCSADEARERALRQLVRHYFGGSTDALLSHLQAESSVEIVREREIETRESSPTAVIKLDESLL